MKNAPDFTDIAPEFDRLKNIKEIILNKELVTFVEKAYSSLQSRRGLKRRDCFKRSLLHYAAMGDCTNLLLYLLQSEPKIDSRDMHGWTPLSWAAEYGSLGVMRVLVDRGANVNAMDYEGGTPLTWLIHAGHPKSKSLSATEAYLRERGAREVRLRGIKWAWVWVLTYSRLLQYIRPHI
jgi:FOG: Ankyrin repeat